MGGAWGRMVHSTKRALYVILPGRTVSHEVLGTTLIEVESLINSRPIGYVSTNVKNVEPLSPAHILLVRPNYNVNLCHSSQRSEFEKAMETSADSHEYC